MAGQGPAIPNCLVVVALGASYPRLEFGDHPVDAEARWFLTSWEVFERFGHLEDEELRRPHHVGVVDEPILIGV